jgi:MPBQ/MSBQ methyltransferase
VTALQRMIRVYNNAMVRHRAKYYENSGFFNFGYWGGQPKSQSEASRALVDLLVDRIAVKGGRVLDVACGVGASTRRLMNSYAPDMILAINFPRYSSPRRGKTFPNARLCKWTRRISNFPTITSMR